MAGKHVETFALKLGKKCPKNGNILWGPGNGCDVSGWCWEVVIIAFIMLHIYFPTPKDHDQPTALATIRR